MQTQQMAATPASMRAFTSGREAFMRRSSRALAACIAIAMGAGAHAQQQSDGSHRPSEAEVLALAGCEGAVLPWQDQGAQIKSGVYDRLYGQWLIVGEKRDEIVSCLVTKHGWTAMSTPDGRRVARAPR